MVYDLLIKHGRVIDGSGMPSLRRHTLGMQGGKDQCYIGKLRGSAAQEHSQVPMCSGYAASRQGLIFWTTRAQSCGKRATRRVAPTSKPPPQSPYSRSLYFKSPTQRR